MHALAYPILAVMGFAIVLVAASDGGGVASYSAAGFARVFFGIAASFSIALIAIILLKEKPLQTEHG